MRHQRSNQPRLLLAVDRFRDGPLILVIAIVDAVAASPPPQLTDGGMWEARCGMMAGFYEARTRGLHHRLLTSRTCKNPASYQIVSW